MLRRQLWIATVTSTVIYLGHSAGKVGTKKNYKETHIHLVIIITVITIITIITIIITIIIIIVIIIIVMIIMMFFFGLPCRAAASLGHRKRTAKTLYVQIIHENVKTTSCLDKADKYQVCGWSDVICPFPPVPCQLWWRWLILHQIGLQLHAAESKIFTTKQLDHPMYVEVSQDLVHVLHEGSSHKYLGRHILGNLKQLGCVELHHRKTIAWAKFNKHRTILTSKHVSLKLFLNSSMLLSRQPCFSICTRWRGRKCS